MRDRSGDEASEFRAKQVAVLYDQLRVALAANLAAAILLVTLLWGAAVHAVLLAWLACVSLISAARLVLIHRYTDSSDASERAGYWLAWFIAGATLSGATWGATVVLLVPDGSLVRLGIPVLWVCGLSAGSVASLSVVKGAFFAFLIPALMPSAVYLLMRGENIAATVGGAEIVFMLFISFNALRMHKTLVHGLQLQIQNGRLIRHLNAEKARVERLNEQLEERVATRTAELATANASLQQDIVERKRVEQALFAEKEKAHVTLHSIGDAVITTDAAGMIEYMNPVAEALTGWAKAEARRQSLNRVFRLVHEQSREPLSNSIEQSLRDNGTTGLAKHGVLLSRDGQEYAIRGSTAPIRGHDRNILGVVLIFSDVTESRRMARQLTHQATHDALTGLVNRREFERRLRTVLDTRNTEQDEHALCYLDLDQFKIINDTCGHVAGDELLRQLANLMHRRVRDRDTFARLGGDEFGILMEHCSLAQAERVANTLRVAIEAYRFVWEEKNFNIGASIGLVPIVGMREGITAVLRAADSACYAAKDAGRNRVHVYREDDALLAQRSGEMQWVARIQSALEQNRFHLYFQPVVRLRGGHCNETCYELLVRLEDEAGLMVLPGVFLPAAERYNLSVKVDQWVVASAFDSLSRHPTQLKDLSMCFINLSGHSVGDEAFLEFVFDQMNTKQIPPERICFEVTETAAVANLSSATRFINSLKARGCRFALDDFGSGLSSFAYLKNLPVDFLKIDGTFVRNIVDDPIDLAMVTSINEIGHVMGKRTIAECVEGEAILQALRAIDVDYAQGYGISPPLPMIEMK